MIHKSRGSYYLVCRNSLLANCAGLECGDVLAVYEQGQSMILRPVAGGPPLGIRARIAAEPDTLTPLEPTR